MYPKLKQVNCKKQLDSIKPWRIYTQPPHSKNKNITSTFPKKTTSPHPHVVKQTATSWWFQPNWKILVKLGTFPQVGVKIKMFETTNQFCKTTATATPAFHTFFWPTKSCGARTLSLSLGLAFPWAKNKKTPICCHDRIHMQPSFLENS